MIPRFWDKVAFVVVIGAIVGGAFLGAVLWHWWMIVAVPLAVSFLGGALQLYRQRGKKEV
jgi:hypothetical protein